MAPQATLSMPYPCDGLRFVISFRPPSYPRAHRRSWENCKIATRHKGPIGGLRDSDDREFQPRAEASPQDWHALGSVGLVSFAQLINPPKTCNKARVLAGAEGQARAAAGLFADSKKLRGVPDFAFRQFVLCPPFQHCANIFLGRLGKWDELLRYLEGSVVLAYAPNLAERLVHNTSLWGPRNSLATITKFAAGVGVKLEIGPDEPQTPARIRIAPVQPTK